MIFLLLHALLGFRVATAQLPGPGLDPVTLFAQLADLPPQQQEQILYVLGESLMSSTEGLECNIFGGVGACQSLEMVPSFPMSCSGPRTDMQVDCIFKPAALSIGTVDPEKALRHSMGDTFLELEEQCPQCTENLRTMWCVQAFPPCGSFKKTVHPVLFPAIRKMKEAQDAGQPQLIAIASAIPTLVRAMSKAMSCRELCESVISTCSCIHEGRSALTLGEAVLAAERQNESFRRLGLAHLDAEFKDTFFKDIWNEPLCNIFTPSSDPDFSGFCPSTRSSCDSDGWCSGLDEGSKSIPEAIIATQIAQSVFAFVDGPAGLLKQSDSLSKVSHDGLLDFGPARPIEDAGSRAPQPSQSSFPPKQGPQPALPAVVSIPLSHKTDTYGREQSLSKLKAPDRSGFHVLFLFGVTVLGAAVYVVYKKVQQRRALESCILYDYDAVMDEEAPIQ